MTFSNLPPLRRKDFVEAAGENLELDKSDKERLVNITESSKLFGQIATQLGRGNIESDTGDISIGFNNFIQYF